MVRREVDPTDGRKWFTVLTDDGDRLLREARTTHNAIVRASFTAMTTATERRTLQKLWRRMAQSRR